MVIELVAKNEQGESVNPYDFEIDPTEGALRELCENCKCFLAEEDKWLKNSLLEAMRISLSLYGIVRIIYCSDCDEAHCAHALKKWLKDKGPHDIETDSTC